MAAVVVLGGKMVVIHSRMKVVLLMFQSSSWNKLFFLTKILDKTAQRNVIKEEFLFCESFGKLLMLEMTSRMTKHNFTGKTNQPALYPTSRWSAQDVQATPLGFASVVKQLDSHVTIEIRFTCSLQMCTLVVKTTTLEACKFHRDASLGLSH